MKIETVAYLIAAAAVAYVGYRAYKEIEPTIAGIGSVIAPITAAATTPVYTPAGVTVSGGVPTITPPKINPLLDWFGLNQISKIATGAINSLEGWFK